jgi:predicted Zn-ribbon and HTH transcriptional regulator
VTDDGKSGKDLSHTLRFMRCNRCGNVFVTSITGYAECPECTSTDAAHFNPDKVDENNEEKMDQ